MKAVRAHGRGGPDQLFYEDAPRPQPGPGELLVRVAATAVIATELTWDLTYQTGAGAPRSTPILGHDLSGTVAGLGVGVTEFALGDAVYGLTAFGRDGAEAEYAIALPDELAPRPRTLDDAQAASVPLAALTAWQALFTHAHLTAGQTALIHGAAGGVGSYAVQLARWAGARVITTSSGRNVEFLRALGADECLDYTTQRFEAVVHDADLVFDTVGHDTLERSWQVVKPGGHLVSVVSPPPVQQSARDDIRFIWFVVEPSGEQLRQLGDLLDAGRVRPIVAQTFPLAEARRAYEEGLKGHARGKIVLTVP
jgi:NADPH:quinone reductase-like Zn-dependent oxidoreductase